MQLINLLLTLSGAIINGLDKNGYGAIGVEFRDELFYTIFYLYSKRVTRFTEAQTDGNLLLGSVYTIYKTSVNQIFLRFGVDYRGKYCSNFSIHCVLISIITTKITKKVLTLSH